jgi:hypothetical protein
MGLAPWINSYKVTRAYGNSEQWGLPEVYLRKSVQVWRWDADATAAMSCGRRNTTLYDLLGLQLVGPSMYFGKTINIEKFRMGVVKLPFF